MVGQKQESVTLYVRMEKKYADLVRLCAKLRGEDGSSFLRRAVLTELGRLGYLNEDQLKALGAKIEVAAQVAG